MSVYREMQTKQPGAWIFPAGDDLESVADFFADHPDWSPALDEHGNVTGYQSPMYSLNDAYNNLPGSHRRIVDGLEDGA